MKKAGVKNVLDEQVCLVTGAAGAIGEAIARLFYEAGARLVLLGHHTPGTEQLARDLDPAGDRILCLWADVTQEQDVQVAVEQAVERFSRIDVAVRIARLEDSTLVVTRMTDPVRSIFNGASIGAGETAHLLVFKLFVQLSRAGISFDYFRYFHNTSLN